jgi:ABC-type glycerol-3-phosphate transport system substrate-binding protein
MNRRFLNSALILALTIALSVGVFAERITVWTWYDGTLGAAFKQLVEQDFEAKTGIEVDLQTVPIADMTTKLLLAVVGGDAPDVVELYSNQVVELGVRGALHNIANMPQLESTFDIMLPGLMRQLSYKSAIFALPGEVNWTWTYYRTDILQEIGAEVPQTWDEMKALSTKLKAREMDVYYDWQGDAISRATGRLLPFVFQRGTDIYTEDGTASNLTDPRVVEGFKELISLFKDYKWPLEDPGYTTFIDGATPIQIYQNWYYSVWERSPQINGKWDIAEIPGTIQKDGTIDRTNTGKMLTWSITSSSKNKDAAAKFLAWAVSPEFTSKFSQ